MVRLFPTTHNLLDYRPDIDGLRAVAVTAVILYHFFPNAIPGGFIGVDVFFVISGYLISSIIFKQLQEQKFVFSQFYLRRSWRLFPALSLVIAATLAYGFISLQIDELVQLTKHASGGTLFISNFIFLRESGYFDTSAEAKPLLHLWSLSVEEQFYLLWPLAIFFVYKKRKPLLPLFLFLAFICSFWFCIHHANHDPTAAFYLPYTRFWELIVGAGIALPQQLGYRLTAADRYTTLQSILGFMLLICGFWGLSQATIFPGWWASLPVIGSALLINAGPNAMINRLLLSHRLVVSLGLISYPLYLWHVPILAYINIESGHLVSTTIRVIAMLLAILFAILTYKCIELPLRRFHKSRKATLAMLFAMALVSTISMSAFLLLERRVESPDTDEIIFNTDSKTKFYQFYANSPNGRWRNFFEEKFRHDCNFFMVEQFYAGTPTRTPKPEIAESCFTRNPAATHAVLIWGDSHAQMINSGLTNNLPSNWQVLQVASSGCAPDLGFSQQSKTEYCAHSNWFALRTARELKPDVVVLAQHDFHFASELNAIANQLLLAGIKKILILGPAPRWKDDLPKLFVRRMWADQNERTMIGVDIDFIRKNQNLKRLVIETEQIQYIDLMNFFCNPTGCLTRIGASLDHNLTSWDRGHLTEIASDLLAKKLLVPAILK